MSGACKQCNRPMKGHHPGKTGLCQQCYLATGMARRGGKRGVPAICWNKRCHAKFNCPPDKDPKWSLCPRCLELRSEWYNGVPHCNPLYR